jgi:hypothetical protein
MPKTDDLPEAGDDTVAGVEALEPVQTEGTDNVGLGDPGGTDPVDLPQDEQPVEAEQPRDERRDSIDPATGVLTAEAVEIRRQEREASGD